MTGPDYWGLVNRDWWMCSHGKQQSPIDIDPKVLLFDPNLKPLYVDKVNGTLENTGQYLTFEVDEKSGFPVFISGGPLGAYKYQAFKIILHFGDKENFGSEHTIDGEHFSGEVSEFHSRNSLITHFLMNKDKKLFRKKLIHA
ncbi:unnamed protein product [Soboliphyme baturini]|uniref:Alpha-carbonic anhydrase domain-containing protein n=1 Tax=Soboliphyme baturini TaxID=241478 RepID=A0A183J399_9BILA|nr:unnamed protein product [Soboliphyme baturini]